jgi:acetyl-CoA/propionyl-CoA carboxylase
MDEELTDPYDRISDIRKKLEEKWRVAAEKQHKKGKLSVKERLEILLDPGSFIPIQSFVTPRCIEFEPEDKMAIGDGAVIGFGTIEGRTVVIYAEDFSYKGGSMGQMHLEKMAWALKLATEAGVPVIGLYDSGGARIQEGVHSLTSLGGVFFNNVMASGWIPQISAVMGPSAGGAVYSPALTDFVFMVDKTSYMFITGPKVVKAVTGEDVTFEELGGPWVHVKKSGVATHVGKDDKEVLLEIRKLLKYLPSNASERPPYEKSDDPWDRQDEGLNKIIPTNQKKPYDIKKVIKRVFDKNSFYEIQKHFAPNAVVGFARLAGHVVGIVANQPVWLGGVLDIDSSDKIARFVRFCDAFNIPIVTFVDTPGYMPGTAQEHGGIIRHGAKVIYAYSEATVPKITVIVRKAYGGAYIAMCSRRLGADIVLAYPTAEIAVMGPEAAIEIVYRKELEATPPEERPKLIEKLAQEYREKWSHPYIAAASAYVDEVIEPKETRPILYNMLTKLLVNKKVGPRVEKKHGNMPV